MGFRITLAAGLAAVVGIGLAGAHDIITTNLTYTRDISRIFERRCVSCHSGDSSIPLTSYEQVRPWAVDIKEQVLSRQMPPWGAAKGFGDLFPDAGLTQEELLIIAAWVVGGAPQGNAALLPARSSVISEISGASLPDLHDVFVVKSRAQIPKAMTVAGIRPKSLDAVSSARLTVTLPDGQTEPLLWLFQYDPKWKQTFRFRNPMLLPAGSVVKSDVPLQFALEVR